MTLKSTIACLALAASLSPAMAADQTISLASGSASFGSTQPLLAGGDDVISFTDLASGSYDYTVSITSQFISDLGASLNGSPLAVGALGVFRFASLQGSSAAPLALTITGTTITSPLASYSVTMSATPVPEPAALGLMLAGLGAIGFVAGRRRKA